ncbi:MAG: TetR/AcrR family transcriptional regulator [Bacteroidetes bacterium]|nr:TetR/AcrR family transcriptional regulator [Bacteroidota bacterium]MBS1686298.1 TetR/AcrR family transcriptional regulator [Bacteroidota bacterium]
MPRRPEQFEELREKSRKKIISAALELFANKGYGSTSIESIARKAGVSKGLIYNYYRDKKSILMAIYDEAMQYGERMMAEHRDDPDPYHRRKVMLEHVFDMTSRQEKYIKLLLILSMQHGALKDSKEFARKMFKRNESFIEELSGDLKTNDPIEGLLLDALIDGIMVNYMRYGDVYPMEALKERIIKEYCTPPDVKNAGVARKTNTTKHKIKQR